MEDYQKYLNPKVLNKINNLELKARLIVEGFISGLHKSPFHGFSVEFAQHREYVPGDDIRYIDWKVYGRSNRYYIKEYEEETSLTAYLLLDSSASMQYASEGNMSKYDYACHVAASMAYLVFQQQDMVGFCTFDDKIQKILPSSSNAAYLRDIVQTMAEVSPQEKTDISEVLKYVGERLRRRGLVVILSDFIDETGNILAGLRHLRHRKHDVVIMHILDPDEINFPLQKLTQFEGLEDVNSKVIINPRAIRNAYLEEINKFISHLKSGCVANRIDYVQITTDQDLGVALSAYLANRSGRR